MSKFKVGDKVRVSPKYALTDKTKIAFEEAEMQGEIVEIWDKPMPFLVKALNSTRRELFFAYELIQVEDQSHER